MRRLLAMVAAIGMVVVAVMVRSTLDREGGLTGPGADRLHVVCAGELADACSTLARAADVDLVVEEAPETADRLASVPADQAAIDLWLVPQPWPAMVDQVRAAAGATPLFRPDPPVVARSPLVAVGEEEGCGWRCLGDRAAAGDLRLGWRSPDRSAVGLLTVGAATSGYFDSTEVATNDFTPQFRSWLDGVFEAAEPFPSPVERQLLSRAFFDVALSYEAEAERLLAQAAPERKVGLAVLYPEPMATVDIVLVSTRDVAGDGERLVAAAGEELAARGWRVEGTDRDRQPPLPAGNGLPGAGVMIALRQETAG